MKYIIKEIKDTINEEASYAKNAQELLESSGAKAVIYGFVRNGKFEPLDEMKVCMNSEVLKFMTEYIKAKYYGATTVRVIYKKTPFGDKEGE